jgi:hypothetical protein
MCSTKLLLASRVVKKCLKKKISNSSLDSKSNPSLNSILNLGLSCAIKLLLVPRMAWKHLQKKKKTKKKKKT